jgi:hypothetical protein
MPKENTSKPTKQDMTIETSKTESPADTNEKAIRDRVVQSIERLPAAKKYPRAIVNNPKIYSGGGMGRRACRMPKRRPAKITRNHVARLVNSLAFASNKDIQAVWRHVYGKFNKWAALKGFNIFVEAKKQEIAIIEAIRRRGLMDKLYDIVIKCIEDYNKKIPEKQE